MSTSPVRVGIIGLGRSGWSIHALGLQQMPEHYQIDQMNEAARALGSKVLASSWFAGPRWWPRLDDGSNRHLRASGYKRPPEWTQLRSGAASARRETRR